MNNKILVTYASRAGSTAGVAEAISKTLNEGSAPVDVLPMEAVKDLSAYRAVVAGSAIQGGRWLPEALQFMQAHQAELAGKPCAIFLVCMTLAMPGSEKHGPGGERYRQQVSTWLDPVRALVKPVSEGLFCGAFDLQKVPSLGDRLKFRMSIALGVWPQGDRRDWNAIRAWAASLSPLLQ